MTAISDYYRVTAVAVCGGCGGIMMRLEEVKGTPQDPAEAGGSVEAPNPARVIIPGSPEEAAKLHGEMISQGLMEGLKTMLPGAVFVGGPSKGGGEEKSENLGIHLTRERWVELGSPGLFTILRRTLEVEA